jgi:hypothetical protein
MGSRRPTPDGQHQQQRNNGESTAPKGHLETNSRFQLPGNDARRRPQQSRDHHQQDGLGMANRTVLTHHGGFQPD